MAQRKLWCDLTHPLRTWMICDGWPCRLAEVQAWRMTHPCLLIWTSLLGRFCTRPSCSGSKGNQHLTTDLLLLKEGIGFALIKWIKICALVRSRQPLSKYQSRFHIELQFAKIQALIVALRTSYSIIQFLRLFPPCEKKCPRSYWILQYFVVMRDGTT